MPWYVNSSIQYKVKPGVGVCMCVGGGGVAHAKLVNVWIISDPGEVLSDALAQSHFLDVRVLVTEVMRATDVEAR
jgi:hypothetical protein